MWEARRVIWLGGFNLTMGFAVAETTLAHLIARTVDSVGTDNMR